MADLFFLYPLFRGQLEASDPPPKAWHSEVTVLVTGKPPSPVEDDETAGGTGSRPLALYKGVRMIVKRYIMNDVTALEDFVNLFRNVKSFHFTTLVNC